MSQSIISLTKRHLYHKELSTLKPTSTTCSPDGTEVKASCDLGVLSAHLSKQLSQTTSEAGAISNLATTGYCVPYNKIGAISEAGITQHWGIYQPS